MPYIARKTAMKRSLFCVAIVRKLLWPLAQMQMPLSRPTSDALSIGTRSAEGVMISNKLLKDRNARSPSINTNDTPMLVYRV